MDFSLGPPWFLAQTTLVGQPRSFQKPMKSLKKQNVKKKRKPITARLQNQTEKPVTKEKRKNKRKQRERRDRESERPILLQCYPRRDAIAHAWRRCPHPHERDPSCYLVPTPSSTVAYPNRRPILPQPLVAQSTLPSPVSLLHCSSLHSSQEFNLSFPSKPNIMFVNLACYSVVCLLNTTVKQFTLTN